MNNLERLIIEGLAQVFTRGQIESVTISINDNGRIPPYTFTAPQSDFAQFIAESDTSQLSVDSLLDLLYIFNQSRNEIGKEAIVNELQRQKELNPDTFPDELANAVKPRLRLKDDPNWRYGEDSKS